MIQLIAREDEWIEWLHNHINYREKLRLSIGNPKTLCKFMPYILRLNTAVASVGVKGNDNEEIKIVCEYYLKNL